MQNEIGRRHFLILEDNAEDAYLVKWAFRGVPQCSCFVCATPAEARAYLLGNGIYIDRKQYPFPDALIADLRLEKHSGLEFITSVRSEPSLKELKVIVLAGSVSPAETSALKELGITSILIKPSNLNSLEKVISDLTRFGEDAD